MSSVSRGRLQRLIDLSRPITFGAYPGDGRNCLADRSALLRADKGPTFKAIRPDEIPTTTVGA